MRTTNANYDAADTPSKQPVVIATFDSVARKYSSDTFNDFGANHKRLLRSLRANLGHIEPLEHRSEIEETEFEVVDTDLDVTDKLKDNDFEGRECTIKLGFQALDEADFIDLPTQKVRAIELGQKLMSWIFTCRDSKFSLKDPLFRAMPQTNLTLDHTPAVGTITVADTSIFIDPTELPPQLTAGLLINGEIVKYTAVATGTTFTPLTRGWAGTTAQTHTDGDTVTQVIGFELCSLPHAMLFLLMTTDDGSGHDYYDINQHLTAPQVPGIGLGLSDSDIDVLQIEQVGWKMGMVDVFNGDRLGAGIKSIIAATFFEDFILKPCTMAWYLKDGKLALQRYDLIDMHENYSAVDTLNDTDDIADASLKYELDDLINTIIVQFDYNPASGQYAKQRKYELDNSVATYGSNQVPYITQMHSMVIGTNTLFVQNAVARMWLYMWGNQMARWTVTTRLANWLIEPNDDLSLTHSKFPDLTDGTRGWTAKKGKVLAQDILLLDGQASFELRGMTWEAYQRIATADFYTKILTGTPDRTAVLFNATNSAVLQAEDGYDDVSGPISVEVFFVTVTITEPTVGAPSQNWQTIGLGVHIQRPTGTDILTRNFRWIRYDPGGSAVLTHVFGLQVNAPGDVNRIKVDWYEASHGGAERPSAVAFTGATMYSLDEGMTEL